MSVSSTESLIQQRQKQHQHQNMTKVGQRKHHKKHSVKDVEGVISRNDVSVMDIEEKNYDKDKDGN